VSIPGFAKCPVSIVKFNIAVLVFGPELFQTLQGWIVLLSQESSSPTKMIQHYLESLGTSHTGKALK
jgi:hypothetical protein